MKKYELDVMAHGLDNLDRNATTGANLLGPRLPRGYIEREVDVDRVPSVARCKDENRERSHCFHISPQFR
jgi:hypothetical protein